MSDGFQSSGGWIEVVAGVMFSGKSEELIRRVRRAIIARKRVQVFKSHLDARYAGVYAVSSHDQRTVDAVPVDSSDQLLLRLDPMAQVVAVDEAQFLDAGIVRVATSLAERGRRVILAGTDTDFRGEPFGAMPQLMAVAESVTSCTRSACCAGRRRAATSGSSKGAPRPTTHRRSWSVRPTRTRHGAARVTRC